MNEVRHAPVCYIYSPSNCCMVVVKDGRVRF